MLAIFKRTKPVLAFLRSHLPIIMAGVGVVVAGSTAAVVAMRTQQNLNVSLANVNSVAVRGPLKVEFGQEVAAGYVATIEPRVQGTWKEERSLLGVSAAVFEPSDWFEAGRSYTLRISGLKRSVTGAEIDDIVQTFRAQSPPLVQESSPADGTKEVPVRPRFRVTLTEANRGVRDLKPALTPAVALRLVSSDDKTFVWEPEVDLKQSAAYSFSLVDARQADAEKARLVSIAFTTITAPIVKSARTGGYLAPGQSIDIVFDQPMQAATDKIEFGMPGKGSWTDERTFRYIPSGLRPGVTYPYKVMAGLRSMAGGVFETERVFEVATNGAVTASLSPGGGDVAVSAPIRVAFDQAVDHASAESRFSITPQVAGGFSWAGNTMTFTPAGLGHQNSYSYAVAAGVTPAWGLPSSRAYSGSFTTTAQVVKLNVPAYRGDYWMSCELTVLRMLLAYRGIQTNSLAVLSRLGYNPRPRDTATNTWDNPNLMYVGDVDGRPNSTGYGVHAGPLADAGRSYGRNTSAYFSVSASFIAARIHEGNPVGVYGHSGGSSGLNAVRSDSWNTSSGVVSTMYPQHARVAYGVVGKPEAPIGFHIIEPMTGGTFYWTTGQLMANMNAIAGVSNQAVVVY